MFSLHILGSGIVAPTPTRYPTGYLVETSNEVILLECNGMAISRMLGFGYGYILISIVCISHQHNDHSGGLCHLIEAISTMCDINKQPMTPILITGPSGLQYDLHHDFNRYWPELDLEQYPSKFLVVEGPGNKLPFSDPDITTFTVNHVPGMPSVGFRIEYEGKVLVYPGDFGTTQYDDFDALLPYLQNADLLILHAGALEPSPNHLTVRQALDIKERSGAKHLLLSHIPQHRLRDTTRAIGVARNVTVATDGMPIDLVP